MQFPLAQFALPFALALALPISATAAQTIHTVTGAAGSRLPEAASAILAASGGTHIVEFSAYSNVGSFFLEGGSADTILFRRKDESTQPLSLTSSALVTLKSFPGTVVFQGLSFRADAKASWLLNGSETGKANGNLIFDSCQIYTRDSLTSANLITWLGATNSRIRLQKTYFVARLGSSGMDLVADTISFDHCVLNASMAISANVRKLLGLKGNTFIRAQVTSVGQPPGSSASIVSIRDNLFLHPTAGHTGPLNLLLMGDVAVDSIKNNARDPSYSGFDQGGYGASFSSGNQNGTFAGDKRDTTELWNWDLPGETTRGAFAASGGNALPHYTLYPGENLLAKRLSSKDSVRLSLDSAEVPRLLTLEYASSTSYPAALDSVRTHWLKDTALVLSGPASVQSIELPLVTAEGAPVLYSENGAVFVPGISGAEGSRVFLNGSAAAKTFIPAFGGQNTPKGSAVVVKGLSSDTLLQYSSISRTGRTRIEAETLSISNPRWRAIKRAGKPVGIKVSTNAEGSEPLLFGLSKTGADAPFIKDSLVYWTGGDTFIAVKDSAAKFWGRLPFASSFQTVLIERLAIGKGKDSLVIPQGRIRTASTAGHQLALDSGFTPTQTRFPDMGTFSRGLSLSWPGRAPGDTLFLEFGKSDPQQKLFFLDGNKAVESTTVRDDSASLTLSFGIGDSGKVVFLARRYTVAAGVKTGLSLGRDSVADLLSDRPGEYSLDSNLVPTGLALDTFRVWTKRRVTQENLDLQSSYTLWLDAPAPIDSAMVSAFILAGGKWDTVSARREGSRYRVDVPADLSGILIAEKLKAVDTLPIYPQSHPSASVQDGALILQPVVSPTEKPRLQGFHVEAVFLDPNGVLVRQSYQSTSPDSSIRIPIPEGSLVAYTAGYESKSGKVTWDPSYTDANTGSRAFLEAVNASAPDYPDHVWDLVGFPQGKPLSDLLSPLGGEASKATVRTWNGHWEDLSAGAQLAKGKGYLLGVTHSLRPSLDVSLPLALKPDSVALDTGWQLVANPLPVPVADASIRLDSASVSYFYSIQWQGSGKDAKYGWVLADTLYPFKGYAVHAAKVGRLRFDPLGGAIPLAKASAPSRLTLTLTDRTSGAKANLYYRPDAKRSSPGIGLLEPDFRAAWSRPDGPLVQGDSLSNSLLVHSMAAGPVSIKPDRAPSSGKVFTLWSGRDGHLKPFRDSIESEASTGWNALKVFEIEPSEVAGLEGQLRSIQSGFFRVLAAQAWPHGGGYHLSLLIPDRFGLLPRLRVQVLDIQGRVYQSRTVTALMPGTQTLDLPSSNWSRGIVFVRLFLDAGGRGEALTVKLLNAGGGQ